VPRGPASIPPAEEAGARASSGSTSCASAGPLSSGVGESNQHAPLKDEGRHPGRPVTCLLRDAHQFIAGRGVPVHTAQFDTKPWPFGGEFVQIQLGGGAMRAAVTDIDLQQLRRGNGLRLRPCQARQPKQQEKRQQSEPARRVAKGPVSSASSDHESSA
jgi:hypothetical protein